jgi:hypothetical protein
MQQAAPNHKHHLHCTRCRNFGRCTDPVCRQRYMHPGQHCSHGFQLLEGQPDCPVHCAWMAIASLLQKRSWGYRDSQCMSNVLLNQIVGLSQHADMPPQTAHETLDQVLEHIRASKECTQALEVAKTFMLRQRTMPGVLEAAHIAPGTHQESSNARAPANLMSRPEGGRPPGFTPAKAVSIQEDWPALAAKKPAPRRRAGAAAAAPNRTQPH